MDNKFNQVSLDVKVWEVTKVEKKDGSYSDKVFIGRSSFSTKFSTKNGDSYINIDVLLKFFINEDSYYLSKGLNVDTLVQTFNKLIGNKRITVEGTQGLELVKKNITKDGVQKDIWVKSLTIAVSINEDGKYKIQPKEDK